MKKMDLGVVSMRHNTYTNFGRQKRVKEKGKVSMKHDKYGVTLSTIANLGVVVTIWRREGALGWSDHKIGCLPPKSN